MGDHAENPLHRWSDERMEIIAYSLPQRPLAAHLRARGLKERAAQLLHLIHQKGQQHQVHEHRAQVFLAQAVVVAEVVALVLEGIEGLVLDPPAGTTAPHDFHGVVRGDCQVGDPTEAVADNHLLAPGLHLPMFEEVDPQLVLAGFVEGHGVEEAKTVRPVRHFPVGQNQIGHVSPLSRCVDVVEHVGMVPGLGREDVAEIMGHQILDVRGVRAQPVLGDDDF